MHTVILVEISTEEATLCMLCYTIYVIQQYFMSMFSSSEITQSSYLNCVE